MPSLQDSRHVPLAPAVLVTGKGGVGKTTVAAALAVAAHRQGRAAAFVEFGDGESGRRALGFDGQDVEHIVIHPDEAITRAATPVFGSAVLSKLVLGNFAMRRLLRAAPALRELAMLESVRQVCAERPNHRVVVDMPATGHGLGWLRVPAQLAAITSPGPFRTLVDRVNRDLIAPGRCSVVVVTLPERLVVMETVELCHAMSREVGLDAARLVVNRMPDAVPRDALDDARKLAEQPGELGDAAKALALALQARLASRDQGVAAVQEVLVHSLNPVLLPLSPVDPAAGVVAAWLAREGAA